MNNDRIDCRRNSSQRGFSLVEIMVAMAILAVGMLGVGTMLITSMEQDKYSTRLSAGSDIAMELVEQMRANTVDGESRPDGYVYSGVHDMGQVYRIWVSGNEPITGIDRVDVWIGWGGSNCSETNPLECKHSTRVTSYVVQ